MLSDKLKELASVCTFNNSQKNPHRCVADPQMEKNEPLLNYYDSGVLYVLFNLYQKPILMLLDL